MMVCSVSLFYKLKDHYSLRNDGGYDCDGNLQQTIFLATPGVAGFTGEFRRSVEWELLFHQ